MTRKPCRRCQGHGTILVPVPGMENVACAGWGWKDERFDVKTCPDCQGSGVRKATPKKEKE